MYPGRCTRCGGSGKELDWTALGRKVRAARKARGLGVRELARQIECSPSFVSDVELGRGRGGVSGTKTKLLLKALGL